MLLMDLDQLRVFYITNKILINYIFPEFMGFKPKTLQNQVIKLTTKQTTHSALFNQLHIYETYNLFVFNEAKKSWSSFRMYRSDSGTFVSLIYVVPRGFTYKRACDVEVLLFGFRAALC